MTRENAEEYLINLSYKLGTMAVEYLNEKDGEKMRDAIKTLEQEPILNKIIAEIESCEDKIRSSGDYDKAEYVAYNDAIIDVLHIIDKYKAESEK